MFTGIIRVLGTIKDISRSDDGMKLTISSPMFYSDNKLGDSISINGTCLTVVDFTPDEATFDLGEETLDKTTFSEAKIGQMVNLEQSMVLGGKLDGHFVQGHVDGVGEVVSIEPRGETTWWTIRIPKHLTKYTALKGSISIDGISLTIADKKDDTVSIMILDYTLNNTNFSQKKPGDKVNVEIDMLAKHIAAMLEHMNIEKQ